MLGLEYSINDAELKKYFSQFGEVAAAEVRIASSPGHAVREVAWYLPFVQALEFIENCQIQSHGSE